MNTNKYRAVIELFIKEGLAPINIHNKMENLLRNT